MVENYKKLAYLQIQLVIRGKKNGNKEKGKALIDNTTFAGAMRILKPDLENHVKFITRYPNFKEVDILSFCEFLTAIVLYEFIAMESS